MADNNGKNDWLGLMQRTKQAYKPTFGQTVLQPFGQAFGQGMVGKQIAQDELRKAMFTALLGKNIPMVTEKGEIQLPTTAGVEGVTEPITIEEEKTRRATIEELIEAISGKKSAPKLTWDPIKVEEKTAVEQLKEDIATGKKKMEDLTPGQQKLIGAYIAPEKGKIKEPTWGQEQRMGALKSGIERGHVVIGKEFGEPEEFDVKTLVDVLRAIELGGYNPTEPYWQELLAKYPAPKIGEIIDKGGKQYKVVGFDKDGIPLVEKVK